MHLFNTNGFHVCNQCNTSLGILSRHCAVHHIHTNTNYKTFTTFDNYIIHSEAFVLYRAPFKVQRAVTVTKPSLSYFCPLSHSLPHPATRFPGGRWCPDHQFQCKNLLCVNQNWVCDGFNDCGDRSDEDLSLCCKGTVWELTPTISNYLTEINVICCKINKM